MKTLATLCISVFLFQLQLFSQSELLNVNPDPNGEPWYVGKLRTLTAEDYLFLDALPRLTIPDNQKGKDLPAVVDNSQQPFFRPVFSQNGGSCGQASGIGYIFTYEIDRSRGVAANTLETQYPTHYTWNFLNRGVGGGSFQTDGWRVIQSNGCPNVADWGGHFAYGGMTRWMSGYDAYLNGMNNRVHEIHAIHVGNEEGLEILKNWMHDHLNGSAAGGIASFGAGASLSFNLTNLPAGTPEAGKHVVTRWGEVVNHGMTFVGYNDEIRYDYNNDGQYTNHLDINNDGVVDMKDWEIGGLKMVNSWGRQFADSGFAYVMYRTLAESIENGGIYSNTVHVISTRDFYEPIITFKAYLKHDSRNKVKLIAGISNDLSKNRPEHYLTFSSFNFQGGDQYMQGGGSNDDKFIEIGLDLTPLLSFVNPGEETRFFLGVVERDPFHEGEGEIVDWSLMDYSNGVEELECTQKNVLIADNDTTFLSVTKAIAYDRVTITTDLLPSAEVDEPYIHQIKAEGGVPPYEWNICMIYKEEDLSGTFPAVSGQPLVFPDNDDGHITLPLDFTFPFFGEEYEQITILTDGVIVFQDFFTGIRTEEDIRGNKCIAAYCADLMLYPTEDDGIWYSGSESGAVIRWRTSLYEYPSVDVEMAVVLYPSGLIKFFYGNDITEGLTWGSGVSNGDNENYTISQLSNAWAIPDHYANQFPPLDYPDELQISSDGLLSCTPQESSKMWDIDISATDYSAISTIKTLQLSSHNTPIEEEQELPASAITHVNNYPNPFSGKATISFTLGEAALVSLQVYDLTGNEVLSLLEQSFFPAGEHSVEIDARTCNSGIYFYRLKTGDGYACTGKMCLVN